MKKTKEKKEAGERYKRKGWNGEDTREGKKTKEEGGGEIQKKKEEDGEGSEEKEVGEQKKE